MSMIDDLTKLYQVDCQVRGLRSRVESAEKYSAGQRRQYDEAAERLEELRTRRRHVKAKIANLETESGGLEQQIEKFRRDLNSASNSKQYQAVHVELSNVKDARSKLDDAILAEMEEAERLDARITEVEEQVAERARIKDAAEAQLRQRRADVGERLAELEEERRKAAAAIPGPELAVFDEVADMHDGEAMATVLEIDRRHREYACGECHMHLPFELVSSLMSPNPGLVRCSACGRILYMQDEVRGALAPK